MGMPASVPRQNWDRPEAPSGNTAPDPSVEDLPRAIAHINNILASVLRNGGDAPPGYSE